MSSIFGLGALYEEKRSLLQEQNGVLGNVTKETHVEMAHSHALSPRTA